MQEADLARALSERDSDGQTPFMVYCASNTDFKGASGQGCSQEAATAAVVQNLAGVSAELLLHLLGQQDLLGRTCLWLLLRSPKPGPAPDKKLAVAKIAWMLRILRDASCLDRCDAHQARAELLCFWHSLLSRRACAGYWCMLPPPCLVVAAWTAVCLRPEPGVRQLPPCILGLKPSPDVAAVACRVKPLCSLHQRPVPLTAAQRKAHSKLLEELQAPLVHAWQLDARDADLDSYWHNCMWRHWGLPMDSCDSRGRTLLYAACMVRLASPPPAT